MTTSAGPDVPDAEDDEAHRDSLSPPWKDTTMTNPGFQAQQAAQQAQQASARAGADAAARAAQQTTQYGLTSARRHMTSGVRPVRGAFGLLGRLIGLVVTLAVLAVVAALFLLVLSKVQPEWFDHIMRWLNHL
ncbi:MAG TPA: hypothetical protein VGL06_11425 [Pseudonocardiaceae bacterium]